MKKKISLMTLISIIFLLVIIISLFTYNTSLNRQVEKYIHTFVDEVTYSYNESIKVELDNKELVAKQIAYNIGKRFENGDSEEYILNDYLTSSISFLGFNQTGLVTLDGKLKIEQNITDITESSYFNRLLNHEEAFITTDDYDEKKQFFLYPININEELKYYFYGTFSLDDILYEITNASYTAETETYIIKSSSNRLIAYSNGGIEDVTSTLINEIKCGSQTVDEAANQIKKDMSENKEGFLLYNVNNNDEYISYIKLEINDWYLLTSLPKAYYTDIFGSLINTTIIVIAIILISFVAFISFVLYKDKKKIKELYKISYYDDLTGGYNFKKFIIEAENIIINNKDKYLYLLEVDIDKFKVINDLFGQDVADKALIHMYNMILSNITENDICCRREADHFTVLVGFDEENEIFNGINEFENKISSPMPGYNYIISPSIGVYKIKDKSINFRNMHDCALLAHSKIKGNVDRLYYIYDEGMKEEIAKIKKMEDEMQEAFKNNEFVAYYQPKVSLKSDTVVGAEALIRWIKKDGKMISPTEFIPIAENNSFIKTIDLFMFETVCKKQREYLDKGIDPIPISVNLSKVLLFDIDLKQKYQSILAKYYMDPKYIQIEITETVAFASTDSMAKILRDLKDLNFTILLDDFGTGYSSLTVLSNTPIDELKIDKSFIDNYNVEFGASLLKNVVQIAKSLKMKTIAEGVEYKEQVELLRKLGCDVVQGYYFYKPLKEEDYDKIQLVE